MLGKKVWQYKIDERDGMSEGLAIFVVGGKYGFVDITGTVVIEPQFDRAWSFEGGLARIEMNGKQGLICLLYTSRCV